MLELLYGQELDAYKKAATEVGIPERMVEGIYDYVEHGCHPGGFLEALLCDSLFLVLRYADPENAQLLKEYVAFLHWCIPGDAWGCKAKFNAWIAKKDVEAAEREPTGLMVD